MNWDTLQPVVRHVLQLGAGALVAKGYLDQGNAEIAIGALVSLGSVVWWFFSKPKAGGPQ